jgi:hypothetical protein
MRTDAINWFASSELCRSLQDGGKTPLTTLRLRFNHLGRVSQLSVPHPTPTARLHSPLDKNWGQRQEASSSTLTATLSGTAFGANLAACYCLWPVPRHPTGGATELRPLHAPPTLSY